MKLAPATAAAAALLAAGCTMSVPEPKPVPAYFGRPSDVDAVRRVMVLTFDTAPGVHADTAMLRDAFLSELVKVQQFELVPLPEGAGEDAEVYESLRRGRISIEALTALGQRYDLDGVLLGTVTAYRPYKPPYLGLRVQLVSLHSATAVWAVEAIYDASDAQSIEDMRHYAQSYLAKEDSLHGWELILISPARFAAYVSHRVVGTWREY